jgi:hypothetical protein
MKVFKNNAQLDATLRALSEAGLIDITTDDDGQHRAQLSAAIVADVSAQPPTGGSRR